MSQEDADRYLVNLSCWKSRPDPHQEIEDELFRERIWLGLESDVAVMRENYGRVAASGEDRRFEERARTAAIERLVSFHRRRKPI